MADSTPVGQQARRPELGDLALLHNTPYFDAAWYSATYQDVTRSGLEPAAHYLWVGGVMRRDPSPYFAASYYLDQNPDVVASGLNPLVHFLRHGLAEGRQAHPRAVPPAVPQNRPRQEVLGPERWSETVRGATIAAALAEGGNAQVLAADALRENPLRVCVVVLGTPDQPALDALQAQSYAPFEVLAQDATVAGARRVEGDPIAAARGDLITYLTPDARWSPDHLRLMAAEFAACDDVMTLAAGPQEQALRKGMLEQGLALSAYMHRRAVSDQLGGLEPDLEDAGQDMILRHTAIYPLTVMPLAAPPAPGLMAQTKARHRLERFRHGLEAPRLAYVLWDWPALSQSFVLEELKWLVTRGFDVEVFYKIAPDRAAEVPFDITAHLVKGPEDLADLLVTRGRTLVHCHFAYPAMTLLAWPACRQAQIRFTFFGHAVDIFLHNNIAVNRIEEVMADPLCLRLFVHGEHHRKHLIPQGIPVEKVAFTFQALDLDLFRAIPDKPPPSGTARGVFIGRFVEKKGIERLVEAAAQLRDADVHFDIYGYGPLDGHLRGRAKALGLDNLTFHGPLDGRDAVRDALAAADFCIVPSIVADTGDTEGFPTIVLEAMAARRPVVTTQVSAIPDYLDDGMTAFLAAPNDSGALADAVRRMRAMGPAEHRAMLRAAGTFLESHVGVDRTMQDYCDTWYDVRIDICLVTYNTADHDDRAQTFDILRRIRAHTSTPYTLTVIDNGSDSQFRAELQTFAQDTAQMRLLLLSRNLFVGPATNLALATSDAVFTIYVCSKEEFIARHGWERPLIAYMRANPDVAMGGSFCHLPPHTLGADLARHPSFAKFRNPDFAHDNPERPFRHVQGGVFILRRDAVGPGEGFSEALPQGMTDVEFSYYLESKGMRLGKVPEVSSVSVKTWPKLDAVLDERTAVAHPLSVETTDMLARMHERGMTRCNLCVGWGCLDDQGICTGCQSTGMDRKMYQALAHDWRAHRGGKALILDGLDRLGTVLGTMMFEVHGAGDEGAGPFALICLGRGPSIERAQSLLDRLAPGGVMLWPEGGRAEPGVLVPHRPDLRAGVCGRLSRVLRSDWRRLYFIEKQA